MLSKASFQNREGDEEAGELITSLKTSENSFTCFPNLFETWKTVPFSRNQKSYQTCSLQTETTRKRKYYLTSPTSNIFIIIQNCSPYSDPCMCLYIKGS